MPKFKIGLMYIRENNTRLVLEECSNFEAIDLLVGNFATFGFFRVITPTGSKHFFAFYFFYALDSGFQFYALDSIYSFTD